MVSLAYLRIPVVPPSLGRLSAPGRIVCLYSLASLARPVRFPKLIHLVILGGLRSSGKLTLFSRLSRMDRVTRMARLPRLTTLNRTIRLTRMTSMPSMDRKTRLLRTIRLTILASRDSLTSTASLDRSTRTHRSTMPAKMPRPN